MHVKKKLKLLGFDIFVLVIGLKYEWIKQIVLDY